MRGGKVSIPFAERITVTIPEFSEGTGNSESKTWQMIKNGLLETITNGRRRLIVIDSYLKLVEQRRSAQPVPLGKMPRGRHRGEQTGAAHSERRKDRSSGALHHKVEL